MVDEHDSSPDPPADALPPAEGSHVLAIGNGPTGRIDVDSTGITFHARPEGNPAAPSADPPAHSARARETSAPMLAVVSPTSSAPSAPVTPHRGSTTTPSPPPVTASLNQDTDLDSLSDSDTALWAPRVMILANGKSGEAHKDARELAEALESARIEVAERALDGDSAPSVKARLPIAVLDTVVGEHREAGLKALLGKVDAVVVVLRDADFDDDDFFSRLSTIRGSIQDPPTFALIPWQRFPGKVPKELASFQVCRAPLTLEAARQIARSAYVFADRKAHLIRAERRRRRLDQERLRADRAETAAATYVRTSLEELRRKEVRLRFVAGVWYALGCTALCAGVGMAVLRFLSLDPSGKQDWPRLAELTVLGAVAIGLLIAVSKYAFSLGKAYIAESLRCADRVHAISFGQLYLTAFATTVQWDEVKRAFEHWNIDRAVSPFSSQASDYDPKLLELAVDLAKVAIDKLGPGGLPKKGTGAG